MKMTKTNANADTYTVRIVARGAGSTVPDNPGAVDAEIILAGRVVGEVTLLPDHDGDLDTWGDGWDHWADDEMRAHLDSLGDSDCAILELVTAVRIADDTAI